MADIDYIIEVPGAAGRDALATSGCYYIDANFSATDEFHYTSIVTFQTAVNTGLIIYDIAHPIKIYPGRNIDGTLIDWSPLGDIADLAAAGMYVHPFNEAVI